MTGENDAPTPTPTPTPARRRPDGLAIGSYLTFVIISGLMVFGFASALGPAVEGQDEGPCRALAPEPRDGSMREMNVLDMNGEPVSLDSLRGKFVVLNFWATWCEPCTQEWPELDKLARRLEERDDVVVVAVSLDSEAEVIAPYLASMGLESSPVVVWRDPEGEANKIFGGEKLPDTYFINQAGGYTDAFINVRVWGSTVAVQCVESRAGQTG